jgi:hypothetical protein
MFGQRVLCWLNVRHLWHAESTEDGQRYRRCVVCGKDEYKGNPGGGDWASGIV